MYQCTSQDWKLGVESFFKEEASSTRLLVIIEHSEPQKWVKPCSWDIKKKIAMSKESGRRIDLLHADALESEKRNQLAMIEGQQFVDPAKDTTTGEMKVKSNQI